jgi:Protein of unknown function (DUF4236)
MGLFYRKSINLGGGLRLNLSKSGIGVSSGIRGLRVGVSPSGKSYIAGGRGGVYFRQYAHANKMGRSSYEERTNLYSKSREVYQQPEFINSLLPIEFNLNNTGIVTVSIVLIVSSIASVLYSPYLLIVSLLSFIGILSIATLNIIAGFKLFKSKRMIKKQKYDDLIIYLEQILKKGRLKQYDHYIIYNVYQNIIMPIIEDLAISEKEKEVLGFFENVINKADLSIINAYFYSRLVSKFTQDKYLDPKEEAFLVRYSNIFKMYDKDKSEIDKGVKYFKELRVFEENPLEKITPSVDIGEECYLETECKTMKYKSLRSFTSGGSRYSEKSYVADKEGKLFITDTKLYMVGQGSSKYLLKNLVSTELDPRDNVIEISLLNRQTPLYISTPDNFKVLIAINKAKAQEIT